MQFLDDELAPEERREIVLHLTECASCRAHIDDARFDHAALRTALAAQRAPDILRVRISHALDVEDIAATRIARRRFLQWLLPGSAVCAAIAAIAMVLGARPPLDRVDSVAREARRQLSRTLPLEVRGSSTEPWLREHFAPQIEVPQFAEPGIRQIDIGARLTAINGHDAALLAYQVDLGQGPFLVAALVIRNVHRDELAGGDRDVSVGSGTIHVIEADGRVAVTYVDRDHTGYMFMAPDIGAEELVRLVVSTDLILRAQQDR